MTKQVFVNRDKGKGTVIPFSVQYHFDNGLILSVIWVNGFATGETADQIEMFETAVIANGEVVMDLVFHNQSFQQVATQIALLEKLDKESAKRFIQDDLLHTVL